MRNDVVYCSFRFGRRHWILWAPSPRTAVLCTSTMQRWLPFLRGSAGTTAPLLPTLSPVWSAHVCLEGTTAASWYVPAPHPLSHPLQTIQSLFGTEICFIQWMEMSWHFLFPPQMVCERSDVFASACAISRAFPIFSRRSASSRRAEKKRVIVEFVIVGQDNNRMDDAELQVLTASKLSYFFPSNGHAAFILTTCHRLDLKRLINTIYVKIWYWPKQLNIVNGK